MTSFEEEVETLLLTAKAEENEDGSPMLAAQCYADALSMLVKRAQTVGVNAGFFASVKPKLEVFLERGRLLAEVAVDEEKTMEKELASISNKNSNSNNATSAASS